MAAGVRRAILRLMKKTFFVLTVVACLAAFNSASSLANAADKSTVSTADTAFVMKAAQGGMTEVQLGQLAADKGTSQDVKDFGSKMVVDHGKANDELKSIASSKGITVPDKLDAKHQAMVDKQTALSGTAFDKAYVSAMVKGHKETDALFTKEASSGQDQTVKDAASQGSKVISEHLQMIQQISKDQNVAMNHQP